MKKFIRGLTLGALAGAATGLLTAPRRGKETQEDLRRNIDSLSARATGLSEAVGAEVERQVKVATPKLKRAKKELDRAIAAAQTEADKVAAESEAELTAEVAAAESKAGKKATRKRR